SLVDARKFDLAICDVQMPKLDGLTLFRRVRHVAPRTAVVIMTSFGRIPDAVGSLRDGAVDYVTKPFDPDEFTERVIGPIDQRFALRRELDRARKASDDARDGDRLVAQSLQMQKLVEQVEALAHTDVPVLLTGERGVGKKLVARLLHDRGPRRNGPFVIVPCTSLPDLMLESELRELSDSRRTARDGWFRSAAKGTIVLDGVDSLPISAQSSLLRVIQEPGMLAHRTNEWLSVGVRLVATARKSLTKMVRDGQFLEPLYFRLNAMGLHVSPLRERPLDLLPLVVELLNRMTPRDHELPLVEPRAWEALTRYPFPGNAHELVWALEHAITLADGKPIDIGHLPARITGGEPIPPSR
ncbi:MAG: sigma 54-interacting transcriptional regulator, partial [Polyangiaceae bacterium]